MRPTTGWKAKQYLYREKICSSLQTHYLESPDIRRPHVHTGIKCWLPAEIYLQCLSEYDILLQTAHKLGSFSSLSLQNKLPSDWHYFFKYVYFSRVSHILLCPQFFLTLQRLCFYSPLEFTINSQKIHLFQVTPPPDNCRHE